MSGKKNMKTKTQNISQEISILQKEIQTIIKPDTLIFNMMSYP